MQLVTVELLFRRDDTMNPMPRALMEEIQRVAPEGAEVVSLEWPYDGEDYTSLCSPMRGKVGGC
jgi:hypothetical protein